MAGFGDEQLREQFALFRHEGHARFAFDDALHFQDLEHGREDFLIGGDLLERLRRSEGAHAFLKGVNAAAVVLIASVLVRLVQAVLTTPLVAGAAAAAAVLIRVLGVSPSLVLLGAAAGGAGLSLAGVALE